MSAPVALPSLSLALATQGDAATASAPVVVVLDGAAEALAALAAAAQIAGTVTSGGTPGELVLLTALGSLSLKTSAPLPAGTRLVIQEIPGRPDAAIVLAIDDVATTARTMAAPPTTSIPPATLPSTVLQLGTTVTATVVAGADNPTVDFSAPDPSPAAAGSYPASPSPAASGGARPATAVAVATATTPPLAGASTNADFGGIAVAPADAASGSGKKTATTPTERAPPIPTEPSALLGNSGTRAPGTVVTLRILAVQPSAEGESPMVPALRGVVQPSSQRQSGTQLDTPAGMLRVFPAPEPAADGPKPPPLLPGTPVSVRLVAASPPTAILTVAAPDAPIVTRAPLADAQSTAMPALAGKSAPNDPVSYRVVFSEPESPRSPGSPSTAPGPSLGRTGSPPDGQAQAALRPVIGTVIAGRPTAGATLIATPFGTLAMDDNLALPPGSLLLLAPQDDPPVADSVPPDPSSRFDKSWSALEATLTTLEQAAPELAAHVRADLSPQSGARLAAGLMVLVAALRDGTTHNWMGDAIVRALGNAGRDDLKLRLGEEFAALRGVADNPATYPWQVFLLPLVDGGMVRPIQLYLKRRGERARRDSRDSNARFILEFELTRFGTMQLDGLVRPRRFDLVLRSHAALAAPLRSAVERIFYDRVAAAGLAGTIDFATAARFDIAPLDALRAKVGIAI